MSTTQLPEPHGTYRDLTYTLGVLPNRDNRCVICFDDMTPTSRLLTHTNNTCNRSFHPECLSAVITQQATDLQPVHCPICRDPFTLHPWPELSNTAKLQLHTEHEFHSLSDQMNTLLAQQASAQLDEFQSLLRPELHRLQTTWQSAWESTTNLDATRAECDSEIGAAAQAIKDLIVRRDASITIFDAAQGRFLANYRWRIHQNHLRHFGVAVTVSSTLTSFLMMLWMNFVFFALVFVLLRWTGHIEFQIHVSEGFQRTFPIFVFGWLVFFVLSALDIYGYGAPRALLRRLYVLLGLNWLWDFVWRAVTEQ